MIGTAGAAGPAAAPSEVATPRAGRAIFAALKKRALSLPGATQDIKWGCDWVATDPKALPLLEPKALVARSHALVLASLPKKRQREILA